jgi:alpha/beta superfamily hydrolase
VVAIPVGDEFTLAAEVTLRDGAPAALVCHPHPAFGGRLDTPFVVALADALARAGLSTVRFNFRGLGGSGGKPTGGHAEQNDVRAVAAWLRAQGAPRVAFVGYSFGALMAMKAVAAGEPADAYAAIGFPTTIIGDDPVRTADVDRALSTRIPWLFLNGDADPFCELVRVRSWSLGHPSVRLDVVPGAGHFFAGPLATELATRVALFVSAAME